MNIQLIASDLSPGDARATEFDFSGLRIVSIRSPSDSHFEQAYQYLWDEFGDRHEVEQKDVIIQRMARDPKAIINGYSFLYEMIAVLSGGELAAVRDQSAIVPCDQPDQPTIVHLSHLLISPKWRGTGLTSWMRAWPVQTARRAAEIAGLPADRPITLAAEMDHYDPNLPASLIRLKSYQKGGFVKVDPAVAKYHQPDFRPPTEIDRTGGPRPIPMALVIRRVGRESESTMPGSELAATVKALYTMYSLEFRAKDMAGLVKSIDAYSSDPVRLVPPTD
jgi:hypothetical protein